ncbi:hypothetical protein AT302_09460 [Pandoraea norimbergensis]|uniref:Secreted protein n=1 Tax=Pandoraea norimbergensis TaxID=93219 RepID=A0ABN4JGJ0_9BURK|nr:hypothetical protein AT302_09460 [Pandoraea norimbergensis]
MDIRMTMGTRIPIRMTTITIMSMVMRTFTARIAITGTRTGMCIPPNVVMIMGTFTVPTAGMTMPIMATRTRLHMFTALTAATITRIRLPAKAMRL